MATIYTSSALGKELKIEFKSFKYDLYEVGKDGVAKTPKETNVADHTGRYIGLTRPLHSNRAWEQEYSVVQSDAVEQATHYDPIGMVKQKFFIDGSYETEDE